MDEKKGQNKFFEAKDRKVRIKIINELCISAATCTVVAPKTFDLDDDGIAYVKEGTLDEAQTIIEGAKSCPTAAIIIEDLDGKQLYPAV